MIETFIVEDDKKNADTVMQIVKNYCPNAVIVGHATGVKEAIEKIKELQPQLLILDIQLIDGRSFEILEQIDLKNRKLIFLTAFEEYAIKAIKFSALDYLLKPVNPKELIAAIEKATDCLQYEDEELSIKTLLANFNKNEKKIVLKTSENINLVEVKEIIHCESDGPYTIFNINGKQKIIVSKSLKEYDELLKEYGFFRAHQSHLVNIKFIERFEKSDGGFLVLKNGEQVPVSTRKRDQLLEIFNRM